MTYSQGKTESIQLAQGFLDDDGVDVFLYLLFEVHNAFFRQKAAQTTSTTPSTKKMLLRATKPHIHNSKAIQIIRIIPQAKQVR